MPKIRIGVFEQGGKLLWQFGDNVATNEAQAEFIVSILDKAEWCLEEGDYFAWDYVKEQEEKNQDHQGFNLGGPVALA